MQGFTQGQTEQVAMEANQLKLQELKRDRDEMMQLQEQLKGMGQDPDLDKFFDVLISTGRPDYVKMGLEAKAKQKEQRAYASLIGGAAPSAPAAAPINAMTPPAPVAAAPATFGAELGTGMYGMAPTNALARPAPVAAAPVNALAQPAVAETRKRINDLMAFAAQASPGMASQAMAQARLLQDQLEMDVRREPKEQLPPRLQDRFVPVGKMVFDRETQQYISPPQSAAEAPQPRAAAAREPAAPGAPKPLTAQQEVQRRDKLGKEFKAAANAVQTTQDVLDSIQNVKDAPGLNRATGYLGKLPSMSEGAAAQAETRFQNLKGKVTALGKAQAAATGAIGSIANQEWKILADQIAALELVKGTGPLLEQLDLVEAQAQGAMERIRDSYQRQFGEDFERFPQFRDLPPPKSTIKSRKSSGVVAPAAAPNIDALLDKYK
tara:strand:+ start:10822 stop:12129 length:1308 start_codon:yes stop_codon:yes gene_type:complete